MEKYPFKMLHTLDLGAPLKRVLGFSKEVLYVLASQKAEKMQALKVHPVRDSNPSRLRGHLV